LPPFLSDLAECEFDIIDEISAFYVLGRKTVGDPDWKSNCDVRDPAPWLTRATVVVSALSAAVDAIRTHLKVTKTNVETGEQLYYLLVNAALSSTIQTPVMTFRSKWQEYWRHFGVSGVQTCVDFSVRRLTLTTTASAKYENFDPIIQMLQRKTSIRAEHGPSAATPGAGVLQVHIAAPVFLNILCSELIGAAVILQHRLYTQLI
jgi:hypothetical protein